MNKLPQQTPDLTRQNIDRIAELFPSAITETKDADGNLKKAINFTILKQLLSGDVVDGEECYEFTWVGKKQSIIEGNKPIRKTLRPAKDESKNWDTTENLYIEGDNLEVLKLLQNSYLNKIKMIYIDPPYNTGNDFVYRDNFAVSKEDYEEGVGVYDEDENRLFKNTETNGRYHSDWCSMMYPRLQLARNLLSDDGVIFISIDENEVDNLRKICDEVFGEKNFLGIITWSKKRKGSFLSKNIISLTEYLLVYSKDISKNKGLFGGVADSSESQPIIKRTNKHSILNIPVGAIETKLDDNVYLKGVYGDDVNPVELLTDVVIENGRNKNSFEIKAPFVWSQSFFNEQLASGSKFIINTMNFQIRVFRVYGESDFKGLGSFIDGVKIKGTNEDAYEELENLFKIKKLFDYSKPVNYVKELIISSTYFDKNAIILDFFSGSATTAHAVMQLNAEDGGNRKFIMVQLPEETDEKSEAYKAGYKNICEIGKERIRRAGKKIEEELQSKSSKDDLFAEQEEVKTVDTGFRVLKLDSTNMKDVYYSAGDYSQQMLLDLESNIKEDRTDLDLLFGVMLDWGVPLSLPHITETIGGKHVHFVNDTDLVACFDENINEVVVREIAKRKPLRVVFRDSSFGSSPEKINVSEIFKTISPDTTLKVI
ncbi:site-specific DNA-methyltransferase [Paludibacter sp.]